MSKYAAQYSTNRESSCLSPRLDVQLLDRNQYSITAGMCQCAKTTWNRNIAALSLNN